MAEIDPEQAAERIRKLIVVGDNRLKQGGDDKYAKARGTFEQALRLAAGGRPRATASGRSSSGGWRDLPSV